MQRDSVMWPILVRSKTVFAVSKLLQALYHFSIKYLLSVTGDQTKSLSYSVDRWVVALSGEMEEE